MLRTDITLCELIFSVLDYFVVFLACRPIKQVSKQ